MTRTITATTARANFPALLDSAEAGETTVVVRHGRPSAVVIAAATLPVFTFFRGLLRELDETMNVSGNPEIIAAVERAKSSAMYWDDEL